MAGRVLSPRASIITPVIPPVVGVVAAPVPGWAAPGGAAATVNGGSIISEMPLMGTEYSTSTDVSLKYFGSPIWRAPRINPRTLVLITSSTIAPLIVVSLVRVTPLTISISCRRASCLAIRRAIRRACPALITF